MAGDIRLLLAKIIFFVLDISLIRNPLTNR